MHTCIFVYKGHVTGVNIYTAILLYCHVVLIDALNFGHLFP